MDILLDASVLEGGLSGIGRATLGFYDAFARIYPDTKIKAIHRRALVCKPPSGVDSVQWGRYFPRKIWRNTALPLYGKLFKNDVIHFPWNDGAFKPNRSTLVVLTIHDVIPLVLPHLYLKNDNDIIKYTSQVQNSINCSDLILTDSISSKNDIIKYFKLKSEPLVSYLANTFPVTNGIDYTLSDLPSEYYVYLGGYEVRKGIEQLVRVYIQLFKQRKIHCPLVLIGYPNHFSRELHASIEEGKVLGAIIEKGSACDYEVITILKSAKALIYPSRYEGFGFPPLEAMSHGCPVITTNISSLPEVCGDSALYIQPDCDEDLVSAILEIDNNSVLRNTMKLKGLERTKLFSWETSATDYYKQLVKSLKIKNGFNK